MMIGDSDTTFNPSGNVTIAETATIAARLNKVYSANPVEFVSSLPWFQSYVNYDMDQGILDEATGFDIEKLNTVATRAEFADILSRALPDEAMSAVNTVSLEDIPDVDESTPYHTEILKMYQVGILIGSDEQGTFVPNTNIQRSAVAAIVNRLADPGQRKTYNSQPLPPTDTTFQLSSVPAYTGTAFVKVNNNIPYFQDTDLTVVAQTHLTELDSLGRCGVVWGCLGPETIAYGERGSIGMIKPSGWHTVRYDGIVDGNYLYNRCHLLMWKASSILDDNRNLITGTRYLNIEGMLPYEEELVDLIESTGFHVLYRVTPIFEGNNLVASGVLMEAKSVEDFGKGLQFCVYAYNVQPGIGIDYATGENWIEEQAEPVPVNPASREYVLNTNTKKFHYPDCSSAQEIKPQNKKVVTETREELINEGYDPCKRCNP